MISGTCATKLRESTAMRHLALIPILIPFAGAVLLLLVRGGHRLRAGMANAVMFCSFIASGALLRQVLSTGRPVVFELGGWGAPFGIVIVADLLSATMAVMCQLVMCSGMVYALGCKDRCVRDHAFYPSFLMLATGLTGTMLTGDLFNLFVFAELMVISAAALTASADDRNGVEAAYKYFYMSTLAAVFLLLACGCLYVSYGTLNMADLARRVADSPHAPLLAAAMVLLLAFFMLKSAVLPFHFWQPDFHAAAPTPVSAMLSSVVVKLGIYGIIRMTTLLFVAQAGLIRELVLVLGLTGIVFGGLGAVGTNHAKRMLAYSTLGQIGFILVAIGWGGPAALVAAVVYALNHSLVKSALLMLAGAVASRAPAKSASFDALSGIGRAIPFAGTLFLVGGIALAGIPPTNGFVSKLLVFRSGLDGPYVTSLVILATASLLTFLYTLRAFQVIWWETSQAEAAVKPSGDCLVAPALLILLCLVFGIWADPLVKLARMTSQSLSDPAAYVQSVLEARREGMAGLYVGGSP